jgi:hypothetical protein
VISLSLLAGCSSDASKATAPTSTTATTAVPATPTTRDPRVSPRCATAAQEVVNYIVGGELHGKLPVGGIVPASEFAKPAFHRLVLVSLNDCSRMEWHTAMQDYVDGGADKMGPILQEGCRVEQAAHLASAHVDGGVVVPIPAACT